MTDLRSFVADLMQAEGAIVEQVGSNSLDVMAPASLREAFAWPELARLAFGPERRPAGAVAVGLEGDWLDRFGALMGERGRLSERQLVLPDWAPPADAQALIDRAITLPNAIWRLNDAAPGWTRLLLLTFRYTATSNEKREGLVRVGMNIATGAVLDETAVVRYRQCLQNAPRWHSPEPQIVVDAGPPGDTQALIDTARALAGDLVNQELTLFLRATRRRLARDAGRLYDYHDDLRRAALLKLRALLLASPRTASVGKAAAKTAAGRKPKAAGSVANTADKAAKPSGKNESDKAAAAIRRERQRITALERDYAAKLDDLRHNYALRVDVELVQTLTLFAPVQRYNLLIKRRKGERDIVMDWHPATRRMEPPPCDFGEAQRRTRHVCDDHLHLTAPKDGILCPSCAKPWCRTCAPKACPCCGTAATAAQD